MRRFFIAGNWKMNLDRDHAVTLVTQLAMKSSSVDNVEIAVCPPSVYIDSVATAVDGSNVGVGAQNMYHEASGAFTGEISAAMLLDVRCKYVILGHSERRHVFGETDADINKKVHAALEAGLIPIVCVGELLEEREAGNTQKVIEEQFNGSLAGVTAEQMASVVLAYEPVWAIGTGKTASPEQAEEVHAELRKLIEQAYNAEVAGNIQIQYGGSVKPSNAKELLAQPNVDGALVGGASLNADDFFGIVEAAVELASG